MAEFTAATICRLYGIPHEANAKKYIESYRDDPVRAVTRLLSRIEQVLTGILDLADPVPN